ncbi:MAG: S1 RNA-binding domain-containing protein [Planctomycetaceae bacterium]|nr:S1 RNA-binding domain-containing protein [Planctomycetaceae bacterium]
MNSSDPVSPSDAEQGVAKGQTAIPTSQLPPSAIEPQTAEQSAEESEETSRRRILIGSQRDPAAYRVRPRHDWKPVEESAKKPRKNRSRGKDDRVKTESSEHGAAAPVAATQELASPATESASDLSTLTPAAESLPTPELIAQLAAAVANSPTPLSKPSVREKLTAEMEDELERAMAGASMDELLGDMKADEQPFEPHSLQSGRVIAVRRDDVFVELGGRRQGIVSLRQFDVPPQVGAAVQVVVQKLNPEDGLYELSVPNRAVQVDDWSDLIEGAIVDVSVTGHNAGGLECEVNHIRGFIPVSQIALYRVEDLAQFVGQRLTCVITEADPDRRNLVLSRRAVLEREREQARQQLLESLRPGQIRDGVVRKLMDFGAFVDLGGVDGLVHVSQMAWGRVKHPSDVLQEGQTIKVRVDKIDPATGKISLAYRDLMESPWTAAAHKYPPNTVVQGTVTKLMDFGAFVEVEPGIEGLVHISELSHKRVWRCSDVVKEGQQVEVMVLSIDPEAQRMSLSMKELSAPPEPAKKPDGESAEPAKSSKKHHVPTGPLLGGLGRKTGDRFGLKW